MYRVLSYTCSVKRQSWGSCKECEKLLYNCGSIHQDEFWKGMLAIHNTPGPLSCSKSPAYMLFGRHMTFFLNSQILRKYVALTPATREKILHANWIKGNSTMIKICTCNTIYLLWNQDPVLQSALHAWHWLITSTPTGKGGGGGTPI